MPLCTSRVVTVGLEVDVRCTPVREIDLFDYFHAVVVEGLDDDDAGWVAVRLYRGERLHFDSGGYAGVGWFGGVWDSKIDGAVSSSFRGVEGVGSARC
jgi:hypothetical protein